MLQDRLTAADGFGLVELMIAMTIMLIAITAIVAGFSSGILAVSRASQASTAGTLADRQMEAYRALPYSQIALDQTAVTNESSIASWLLTKDHKRIAILYLIAVSVFFALGGLMAVIIRLELATPEGDLVQPDIYNRLFTMHGVIMVFFFLIPAVPGTLGNFLIPLMIGAKDLAFPKINLLSWYIYIVGGLFTFYALISGGADTGTHRGIRSGGRSDRGATHRHAGGYRESHQF